ncbi:site-specific integrase [Haladaptatus cibarius]|uniref:site-specific integrase n=1 Tax=Haladaptatus cibarius TaxID=453847 RepID=UPI00067941A1|nr:site-specific integrase [Haladaptatus cibarius]
MPATREKALTEHEFELLLEGANRICHTERRLEARATILLGGRLGLRPGEVTHLSNSWIDWDREMIHIPEHHICQKGQNGGLCGYCRQAVEQRLRHGADESFEELADRYWLPKTPAAVRSVPFHFSSRVRVTLELLSNTHDGWPYSFSTLQRRVETALEAAPRLPTDATSPHGLRATAASYHAGRGLDLTALRAMFGWEDLKTARQYLNVDGAMTRRALSAIH